MISLMTLSAVDLKFGVSSRKHLTVVPIMSVLSERGGGGIHPLLGLTLDSCSDGLVLGPEGVRAFASGRCGWAQSER